MVYFNNLVNSACLSNSGIVRIATTIPPAETEVFRTPENTTCYDRVLPISILPTFLAKGGIVRIATPLPPAETEVCRTQENNPCSGRVLPIIYRIQSDSVLHLKVNQVVLMLYCSVY